MSWQHFSPRWFLRRPASFDKRFATKEVHTWKPINVSHDLEIQNIFFSVVHGFTAKMFPLAWIMTPQKWESHLGSRRVAGRILMVWFSPLSLRYTQISHTHDSVYLGQYYAMLCDDVLCYLTKCYVMWLSLLCYFMWFGVSIICDFLLCDYVMCNVI